MIYCDQTAFSGVLLPFAKLRMNKPLDHRHHFHSLDGLRGVAVLVVVAFHYYPRHAHDPLGALAGFGWLGVDLFFVLSGFLITGILFDTVQEPRFFRNFYVRRVLRLMPIYLIMVAVVLIISFFHGERPTIWALPFFAYGSNTIGDLQKDIGVGHTMVLGHLWSLAVEEQFYFFWPPLIFFMRSRKRILRACLLGCLALFGLRIWILMHPNPFTLSMADELPLHMDGLLLGGALSMLMRDAHSIAALTAKKLYPGFVAGGTEIVLCAMRAHSAHFSRFPMDLFGTLSAAIGFFCVIALALQPQSWVHRMGSWQPLRVLGRYSYGLYLWHQLPDAAVRRFEVRVETIVRLPIANSLIAFSLVFGGCLLVAMLSYHLIELPFLKMKRYFAYRDEQKTQRVHADAVSTVVTKASV